MRQFLGDVAKKFLSTLVPLDSVQWVALQVVWALQGHRVTRGYRYWYCNRNVAQTTNTCRQKIMSGSNLTSKTWFQLKSMRKFFVFGIVRCNFYGPWHCNASFLIWTWKSTTDSNVKDFLRWLIVHHLLNNSLFWRNPQKFNTMVNKVS